MLTICPTPIGNLDDMTKRQHRALADADVIACEDTRRTGKLLELVGIERVDGRPELWRYDDHAGVQAAQSVADIVEQGKSVVLVSDAGTPTISDPGYRLVSACRKRGLEVTALPGPVAATVALSGSGMATDRFYFEGFLPSKAKARRRRLEALDEVGVTVVAYESPRRIVRALKDVEAVCGSQREVCVARELTKLHEEYLVGSVEAIRGELEGRDSLRGEFVLCIGAAAEAGGEEARWKEVDRAIEVLHQRGVRRRTIKDFVAEIYEVPRAQIYDRIDAVVGE